MEKEILMMELIDFCEDYNAIGFGRAKITELNFWFIVELYNAGYSENEELDTKFKSKYKHSIILNRHPITIAEFSKLNLTYNYHVVDFEGVCKNHACCCDRDNFKHLLEIN